MNQTDLKNLRELQKLVSDEFDGTVTKLIDDIYKRTGVLLAPITIRRFYQKAEPGKVPSPNSLDVICKYVGFEDWNAFRKRTSVAPNSLYKIIEVFYDMVSKKNYFFFDAKLRETHETYASFVLKDLDYAYSFLERYKSYPIITQSLYPWYPYHDRMSQKDYVDLIKTYLATNPLEHLHLCQNSFLAYGAYCSGNWEKAGGEALVKEADKYIQSVYNDYPNSFFYYPETHYVVAKMIQAYHRGDDDEATAIAENALERNEKAQPLHVFEQVFDTPDVLISNLCNCLIWMDKIEYAIYIYKQYNHLLWKAKDPVEEMWSDFAYERDTNLCAQTVEMMHLFDSDIELLTQSRLRKHWKTEVYEEVQQNLIGLKKSNKRKEKDAYKLRLKELAQQTNFGVIENLIQLFQ